MRDKHIPDTRIHAALYFIAPTGHTLKAIDIVVMKRLSEVVNVVPVIAKSDSLTLEEREAFKQRVRPASLAPWLVLIVSLLTYRPSRTSLCADPGRVGAPPDPRLPVRHGGERRRGEAAERRDPGASLSPLSVHDVELSATADSNSPRRT